MLGGSGTLVGGAQRKTNPVICGELGELGKITQFMHTDHQNILQRLFLRTYNKAIGLRIFIIIPTLSLISLLLL